MAEERDLLLPGDELKEYYGSAPNVEFSKGRRKEDIVRWISLAVVFAGQFAMFIQGSIYWVSIWPYLSQVDPTIPESFQGYVIAVYNVGVVIASPLFGYWSNRMRQTRVPILAGIVINLFGCLLFAFVEAFPMGSRRWIFLLARFIAGFGSGNQAPLQAYVAMASTLEERNRAFSINAATISLAVMLGPGLQTVMEPIGYPAVRVDGVFFFNMYTAPAYFSVIMDLVIAVLFLGLQTVMEPIGYPAVRVDGVFFFNMYTAPAYFSVIIDLVIAVLFLGLQTVMEPIGYPAVRVDGVFFFNMYTAPAYFSVIMDLVIAVLFLGLQTVMEPIGYPAVRVDGVFFFNMYTAPAYFSVIMDLVIAVLFLGLQTVMEPIGYPAVRVDGVFFFNMYTAPAYFSVIMDLVIAVLFLGLQTVMEPIGYPAVRVDGVFFFNMYTAPAYFSVIMDLVIAVLFLGLQTVMEPIGYPAVRVDGVFFFNMYTAPAYFSVIMDLVIAVLFLGLQTVMEPIGYPAVRVDGVFFFNMYTAPAYFSVIMDLVIAVLFLGLQTVMEPIGYPAVRVDGVFFFNMYTAPAYFSVIMDLVIAVLFLGLQTVMEPIGYPAVRVDGVFFFNMYTAPAYFSVIMDLVIAVLFLVAFKEYHVAVEEDDEIHKQMATLKEQRLKPYDKVAVFNCVLIRFVMLFCVVYDDTVGSPFTMAMFGWSRSQAVLYNGIISAVSGIFDFAGNLIVGNIVLKYVRERVMILIGLTFFLCFYLFSFSWPGLPIYPADPKPIGVNITSDTAEGCYYDWCSTTPRIYLAQYIVAFSCLVLAFSTAFTPTSTLYSKVLGPIRQGTMQGVFVAAGNLGMTVSPILVSYLFEFVGPRIAWIVASVLTLLTILSVAFSYKRMISYHDRHFMENDVLDAMSAITDDRAEHKRRLSRRDTAVDYEDLSVY